MQIELPAECLGEQVCCRTWLDGKSQDVFHLECLSLIISLTTSCLPLSLFLFLPLSFPPSPLSTWTSAHFPVTLPSAMLGLRASLSPSEAYRASERPPDSLHPVLCRNNHMRHASTFLVATSGAQTGFRNVTRWEEKVPEAKLLILPLRAVS